MYSFEAQVVSGQGRGKRIGFPTINLDKKDLKIEHGVYLVKILFDNKEYSGLLHFGPKETFDEGVSVEVHIKDFNLDIYQRIVKIRVIRKIRDIKKFLNQEDLKEQINKDLKEL